MFRRNHTIDLEMNLHSSELEGLQQEVSVLLLKIVSEEAAYHHQSISIPYLAVLKQEEDASALHHGA